MPEVLTLDAVTQIGVESTPGTGVAANKKFQGLSIVPSIKGERQLFRPNGYKFATVAAPIKEWASAKITGYPTYEEIVYLLSSIMDYAAPVQQGGTIAYKWSHNIAISAASTTKAFTVEHGGATRAWKFEYGTVTDMELNFSRSGVDLSGTMIGEALQDGITMTGGPTVLAATPILPTQVDVKVADTQAGIAGASALTRVVSAGFSIAGRHKPWFPLATAGVPGPTLMNEAAPTVKVKLKLEADATGMGLLTQMRAGSSKFIQIKAVGALIATSYYYTLDCTFCGKVIEDPTEFSDEDGIYAIEWTFDVAYDSTWTKAMLIEVTNTITAL